MDDFTAFSQQSLAIPSGLFFNTRSSFIMGLASLISTMHKSSVVLDSSSRTMTNYYWVVDTPTSTSNKTKSKENQHLNCHTTDGILTGSTLAVFLAYFVIWKSYQHLTCLKSALDSTKRITKNRPLLMRWVLELDLSKIAAADPSPQIH
ncbi:hypothetical protein BCR42DRAFT_392655 [Absidia repens]|uniref:Uncharacterized protein n=1 Tax=Absidia repens TaxID=90262 RepID=A0A1X2IFS4_9FUNG|nr:hypothetical protein BCR42DRAFT_392655 [Absidia repens]